MRPSASSTVRSMVSRWASKRSYSASAAVFAPRAESVGILGMEAYVAERFVSQEALEKADGVSAGKYTIGMSISS